MLETLEQTEQVDCLLGEAARLQVIKTVSVDQTIIEGWMDGRMEGWLDDKWKAVLL